MSKLKVATINNQWYVTDGKTNSKLFRKKSEAYTELNRLNNPLSTSSDKKAHSSEELEEHFAWKNPTYQKLDESTGQYKKFKKGHWTIKKSDGAYKNIPIFEG